MEGVPVPRRDSAPGGKPRPPGSPYLLRPTPGLTGHTSEGHLVMRGPWKSSPQLPLSKLTVPPLQFQNIQQNHLETGLEWGSGEAGRRGAGRLELGWGWCWSGEARSWVSLSEDSACSPFRSHCGGSALPTTADNRIFNDYDYHLNNWKLPQIIKMRFGSSLPISGQALNLMVISQRTWKQEQLRTFLQKGGWEVNVDADAQPGMRGTRVYTCALCT